MLVKSFLLYLILNSKSFHMCSIIFEYISSIFVKQRLSHFYIALCCVLFAYEQKVIWMQQSYLALYHPYFHKVLELYYTYCH